MPGITVILIAGVLLITLLGSPAPDAISFPEVALSILEGLIAIVVLAGIQRYSQLHLSARKILLSGMMCFAMWSVAAIVGFQFGNDPNLIFRSFAPQVAFIPILLAGICLVKQQDFRWLHGLTALIGVGHACYLIYLFLTVGAVTVDDIVLNRTTFLDDRTTLPWILAAGVLPLPLVLSRNLRWRLSAIAAEVLSFAAAFSTQTRAQIISLVVGVVAFFLLLALHSTNRKMRWRGLSAAVGIFAVLWLLAYKSEIGSRLVEAVIVRSYDVGDTGRIAEEWIPALNQWWNQGWQAIPFGIGLGSPITTADGDERTYIHNIVVYLLVYTGVVGTTVIFSYYYFTVAGLIRKARASSDMAYLAYAAFVIALFSYAQLFAVHKLLSFNAMVACCSALAFERKERYVRNRRPDLLPTQATRPQTA